MDRQDVIATGLLVLVFALVVTAGYAKGSEPLGVLNSGVTRMPGSSSQFVSPGEDVPEARSPIAPEFATGTWLKSEPFNRKGLRGSVGVEAAAGFDVSAVNVRLVTDEADAVLTVLNKRKANQPIGESDWQQIFQSEGYVRLKKRETAMKNPFEDADFKTFVLSDSLAERTRSLEETLERWKSADNLGAARLALAYLPKEAQIKVKIYLVIKPRDNSFVFDVKTDPAIFLYLDPTVSREKFENTLAHELHHIGYSSSCPSKKTAAELSRLPENKQAVIRLIGAFGEGFAMLAAAGGPDVHPHAVSSAEERARWDKDVANFNDDLRKVEKFFLDLLANRLTDDEARKTYASFFGVQGPWYTVGWKMSVMIEKTFGRARLIQCICDQRLLLATYNSAALKHNRKAKQPLELWATAVVNGVEVRK
ncbi:MAG TPA: DUF5700 domain-containing putative Zn-dependent protease [Pyrinomonadaceae bacterium]|nr:DUF5700 domain-containing putative Zn-dependent protease [Pyrinomonadaceae bacterium]